MPGRSTTRALMVSPHLSSGEAAHAAPAAGGAVVEAFLDLDRGDVLAAGDDYVLLAVGDGEHRAVQVPAVAGVEPAVPQRLRRLLRLLPVAAEHVIGTGQHFALGVGLYPDADRGHARPR